MSKLPPEKLRRLNSMEFFIAEIRKANVKPKIIFDIGAYNAAHLKELCGEFNVPVTNGYAFEAHPGMIKHCKNRGVNVLHCAISDFDGEADFNAIDLTQQCHHGCSSLYHIGRPHNAVRTQVRRIDSMINDKILPMFPEVVKIDVEGKSYEVLEGFGRYLSNVKVLHVEVELKDCYGGQKTKDDIVKFMDDKGFKVVHSLWIPEFQEDLIFLKE